MENKKYTRKMFLTEILAMELTPEQRDCAEQWLIALNKKSSAPTVNKKALENEQLAHELINLMSAHADAQINAKWIAEHLAGVTTPQKGTAVALAAKRLGLVVDYKEKGRSYYKLA